MKQSPILPSLLSTVIGIGILLALTGCATQPPAPSALCTLTDDNGNPIPATFTGTLNPRHQGHAATHVVFMQKAETACCNGFDSDCLYLRGISSSHVEGSLRSSSNSAVWRRKQHRHDWECISADFDGYSTGTH